MSHYFDPTPSAASHPAQVEMALPDLRVSLLADRGVFSARGIDAGTLELLKAFAGLADPLGDVLDLGCGYGPIAVALASRYPASTVWALDVNTRALELTAANAASLGLANVRAVEEGDVPPGICFAEIWSNPPIRIGKTALQELLARWLSRLLPGGTGRLVVQKHLGADSLAQWLRSEGFGVRREASKRGYRILRVDRI